MPLNQMVIEQVSRQIQVLILLVRTNSTPEAMLMSFLCI